MFNEMYPPPGNGEENKNPNILKHVKQPKPVDKQAHIDNDNDHINIINESIIDNGIDKDEDCDHEERSESKGFVPKTDNEALALDILLSLNDNKSNLPLYIHYCNTQPRVIIERAWKEAKAVAPAKIRKSKGALFNYLVSKYAAEESNNPRD